jgi:hypothetical protein
MLATIQSRTLYLLVCCLRMFEKRVLRRIFGQERNEMTKGWIMRTFSSPNIICRMIKLRTR